MSTPTERLKADIAHAIRNSRPSCECGVEREPTKIRVGSLSLTVCARCDGLTTPKEDDRS